MASNADRYRTYVRGWRHGATGRARDPKFLEHHDPDIRDIYAFGERDGREAARLASKHATETYGYTPSILRVEAV